MSHAKSTRFGRLSRRSRVTFATHLKVEGKSTCDCISNIPSTKHTSTFQGAPVIILTSSLLKRVDLSIEVLSQYDQYG